MHGWFYTNTIFSARKSSRGSMMAQLFVNDAKYLHIFPMKKNSDVSNPLQEFIQDIGIPAAYIVMVQVNSNTVNGEKLVMNMESIKHHGKTMQK